MTEELGELVELPSGMRLLYRDEDHSYWRCKDDGSRGKRLTGVTTAIGPIDFEKERLLAWAARMQCLGIAELAAPALADGPTVDLRRLSWLSSQESIWRELEEYHLDFLSIRDQAATIGTNIHERVFWRLAAGEPAVPEYAALSPEERGYADATVSFWLDHDPDPLQAEQIVADERLGIAGRFDLRARLHPCQDQRCPCRIGHRRNLPALVDAKTGKWISEASHVQLPAYDYLADLCGIGRSWPLLLLHLHDDGSYQLIQAQGRQGDFTRAVDIYRRRARIQRADRKARKAREEQE